MLIGFTGKAGSGKDTAASIFNPRAVFLSFADPIKKSSKILFNLSDDQLTDRILKETVDNRWNISPREIFQKIGTNMKLVHNDVFIIGMKERIQQEINKGTEYIIITDARFENECKLIKELNGKIIKIIRNSSKLTSNTKLHESETQELDKYVDYNINNTGTLEELTRIIKNLRNVMN
jgi:hypothetical protein